jgi:hypothetical protein
MLEEENANQEKGAITYRITEPALRGSPVRPFLGCLAQLPVMKPSGAGLGRRALVLGDRQRLAEPGIAPGQKV